MHHLHLRVIPTWISTLTALTMLLALTGVTSAQDATPSPDPATIVDALASSEPPGDLPGNDDAGIELHTWQDFYGEALEGVEGAWLLTGSTEFPIATIIVFASNENAQAGLGDYRSEESHISVNGLDAWTVADRGKWICIAADGPVVVIGQAFPEDTSEPQGDVERRACDTLVATLDWLHRDVLGLPPATPGATPRARRQAIAA